MRKKSIITILACCAIFSAQAQTLFTYGNHQADAKDFLRAFYKNNTQPVANKSKAMTDYLDLYIKSRLKIQEAYERGFDTLPQVTAEVTNLRAQIADNYMTDAETSNRLLKEAFQRSQKDIHVAHIFISFKSPGGGTDSGAVRNKRDEILQRLQKGEDFLTVAQQLSDDPAAKNNKGDLGYITVFTLPHAFETVVYSTPVGKYSQPVLSKIGYHIFKNMGERKAAGKIKAQQILLAIPPGSDEDTKKQLGKLADSLYKRILAGSDFGKLATQFSNDYISAANNGTMPDISVGQYDPAFENVLWSLPKDGAVSKPFLTSHGWHIVKRTSLVPIITDPENKTNQQDLQQRIFNDNRWKPSEDFIYNKVMLKPGLKKPNYNDAELWAVSDSLLDKKPLTNQTAINSNTVMFTIGNSEYRVANWIEFANNNRFKANEAGYKPYDQLRNEYVNYALKNYYRDHLEDYNADFYSQMTEFKDGNLFFEIMQQEIWNKAQSDSAGLIAMYNKNKKNYTWKQSADAVVFFCSDKDIAKVAFDKLKKTPDNWKVITEQYAEKVIADSARYELSQIPNLNKMAPKAGMLTTPLINKNDNTASFAYIIKTYPLPMQRSFSEARGLVINDYQTFLEEQWVATLKKKYPVVIDQKVLSTILK